MGKRSRKRVAELDLAPHVSGRTTRAERDTARHAGHETAPATRAPRRSLKTRAEDRPAPPWGGFPLMELLVLIAIGLFIWGIASHNGVVIACGLAVGSLGGLELAIREHFTGFRSHTTMLAGATAFVALVAGWFASGGQRYLVLPIVGIVFLAAFWLLRQAFSRRSGGVTFRR